MASGNIISGFEQNDTGGIWFGVLLRMHSDGTIKWKRKYLYQNDSLIQYITDFKQTNDGGYIMAGEANEYYHEVSAYYPWQRAWLIKVDSNGCASSNDPQCWPVAMPHEPVVKAATYKVYPNPAADQLQLSFLKTEDKEEVFVLADITGRIVTQSALTGLSGSTYMDVRHLQRGIYQYRITESGAVKAGGKITKQ